MHAPQDPSNPNGVQWKRVAASEEFFDIVSQYHCTEDGKHLGIKRTLAEVHVCMYCEVGYTVGSRSPPI